METTTNIIDRDEGIIEEVKERRESYSNMTLGEAAEELVQIKLARKFLEEIDDVWKDNDVQLKRITRELMDENGIGEYTVDDTAKIKAKLILNGDIQDNVKFFFWLLDRGDESLGKLNIAPHLVTEEMKEQMRKGDPDAVTLYVHHQTLKSFLADNCDPLDPKTWPDGVEIDAHKSAYVSIKRKKK